MRFEHKQQFFTQGFDPDTVPWEKPQDRFDEIHNRWIKGLPYQGYGYNQFTYAGKSITPLSPASHAQIFGMWKILEQELKCEFCVCLADYYADNTVGIPYHYDEVSSDQDLIVSVSFGATRLFQNRADLTGRVSNYILEDGDVMIFDGVSQRLSQHCVPPMANQSGELVNLTFRT